jgi:hypothetical protein
MANEGSRSRFSTSETVDSLRERATEGYHRVEEMVGQNPASSVVLCFGLGLGLGMLIGASLLSSTSSRREEASGMAERLGRQLMDAISSAMPESLSGLKNAFGR